ncbi:Gfo/Idh/MocA family oxidoreductase [Aurantibacter crassamenti]|uniref:Gfo/Idh/MocA family protein n=1 Tax=Aurantibacter crassamenti TaxID=1837375 RepID=UPI00193A849F|nr:Gfo/Idh/MocA family oxidoreductase [Aurantibacter crassamenti]MBM1107411.1 Gfo/Idh/MocA family oxidoreductase [Aurantibacter crassamenti]
MGNEIRWGIAGPGKIAHKFAQDLQLVKGGHITAVGSRSIERAKAFAKEYGAQHAYASYEALFKSEEIDIVYIATPHNSHAELTLLAIKHGKHVLCEKPGGVKKYEVQQMVNAAQEKGVFFMEALWSRFNPAIKKVKALIDSNEIGDVGYLKADFAFYGLDRDEKGRLLNPDLAGGSLLDIGIYPIFLSYLILGKPQEILATSKFHTTGVEIQTAMIFNYKNAQALLYSGNSTNSECKAEIAGATGSLFIPGRWHEAQGYSLEKNDELTDFDLPRNGYGYTHEIEEVHKCLQEGKTESELWSHQNSLDLIELLDAVRAKAGITFPFEK